MSLCCIYAEIHVAFLGDDKQYSLHLFWLMYISIDLLHRRLTAHNFSWQHVSWNIIRNISFLPLLISHFSLPQGQPKQKKKKEVPQLIPLFIIYIHQECGSNTFPFVWLLFSRLFVEYLISMSFHFKSHSRCPMDTFWGVIHSTHCCC